MANEMNTECLEIDLHRAVNAKGTRLMTIFFNKPGVRNSLLLSRLSSDRCAPGVTAGQKSPNRAISVSLSVPRFNNAVARRSTIGH